MKKFKNLYSNAICTESGIVLPGESGIISDRGAKKFLKLKRIILLEREDVGQIKSGQIKFGKSMPASSVGHKRSDVEEDVQGRERSNVPQTGASKSQSDTKQKSEITKRTSTKRPVIR